ncbi:MAG: response regulator [Pseudomonadota bacterium]
MMNSEMHGIDRQPIENIKKILVVDDHKMLCSVMHKMLGLLKIPKVKSCHSGQNALQILAEFQPDIVITDLHMHPVSGIELLKAVRCGLFDCDRAQAVIMLTSNASKAVINSAIELDLDFLMMKPPIKNALSEAINLTQMRLLPIRSQGYYHSVDISNCGIRLDIDNIHFENHSESAQNSIQHTQRKSDSINLEWVTSGINKFDEEYRLFQELIDDVKNRDNTASLSSYIHRLDRLSIQHFNTQKPYIEEFDPNAERHLKDHEILLSMIRNLELSHQAFKMDSSEEFLELLGAMNIEHFNRFDKPLYLAMRSSMAR